MKNLSRVGSKSLGIAVILILLVGLPITVAATVNSGNVSGTVTYTGSISGTQNIIIGVHSMPNAAPVGGTSVVNPGGAYSVASVADGTYYVSAYLDVDGSGGEPGDDEPIGWYDVNSDGAPDTITVSGGNVTGVDIDFGDINHSPEIMSLEGQWQQLGSEASANRAERVDLAFFSEAEHNTPGVLFSNYQTGLTMMKWDGGSDQAWEPVGSLNFASGGTFINALDISDSDVPYAAYANETNNFRANVERFQTGSWASVDSADFSPNMATPIDMQLKSDGVTPVVVFRDGANFSQGTAMTLGASGWEDIGSAGFTPWAVDDVQLALDSSDAPWVAYQGSGNLGVMKYTGNGTSGWEYAAGVTSFVSSAYDISIAIDSIDTVYVAFADNSHSGKATVMKHTGALSTTWQTVGTVGFSTCGTGAHYPSIAIDHNDIPYVVFHSYCDGGAVVMKYTGAGTSGWETVGDAGFSGGNVLYPVINFNNDDTPFVAFIDSSTRHPFVMYFDQYPAITETAVTMSEDSLPLPFNLSLRGFDQDDDALAWSIATQGTHGIAAVKSTLGSTGTVTATFAFTPTVNFNGADSFAVQLDDGSETVTATVNITIDPINDAPSAYFSDQTVAQGETVTLDGTLSTDIDGDDLTDFYWTQTGGTAVSFTDNLSQTTFIAPTTPVTLSFSLSVTDTGSLSDDHDGTVWVVGGDYSTAVHTDTQTVFAPPTAPFTITVPVGGVDQPLSLIFTDALDGYSPPADRQFVLDPFSLDVYIDGVLQSGFAFNKPFTITLKYRDDDLSGLSESTLTLLYWDGGAWVSNGVALVSRDLLGNQITLTVDHLTDFAFVADESYEVYVPLVLK